MKIKKEKGLKPRKKCEWLIVYPFHELEADESFFIEIEESKIQSLRVAAYQYAKKTGVKLSVQKEDNGARVFRLE